MGGTRFDDLIKRLGTRRLTRLTAVRGLAAGAVASVTGLRLFGEESEAKKDGKKTRRRRICHRTSASDPGVTRKLKAKRAKKHLRKHPFDTKGACSAAPRVGCLTSADCPPGQVCQNSICVIVTPTTTIITQPCSAANCPFFCVNNVCVQCRNSGDCPPGQTCSAAGICVGPGPDLCGNTCTPGSQVCCPAGTDKAGICVGNFTACAAD